MRNYTSQRPFWWFLNHALISVKTLVLLNICSVLHYDDVIMTMLASQITSLTVVYSIVYSGVNQRKHQSSASLAFVREIHRGPVNFPRKWPVTRKMFPFDDVIMNFWDLINVKWALVYIMGSELMMTDSCHSGKHMVVSHEKRWQNRVVA